MREEFTFNVLHFDLYLFITLNNRNYAKLLHELSGRKMNNSILSILSERIMNEINDNIIFRLDVCIEFFFSSILIRAATLSAKCKWEYLNERSPLCRQRTIEKVNEARRNTEKSRHRERQAESASMKGRNLVNGSAMRLVFLLQSHAAAVLHYDHACTREREFLRDRGR